jgi:hypothetical protein
MSTVLAVGLVLEQEVLTPTLLGGRADESGALTSVAQCDAEVLSLDKSASVFVKQDQVPAAQSDPLDSLPLGWGEHPHTPSLSYTHTQLHPHSVAPTSRALADAFIQSDLPLSVQ